jgi:hypothetical protein
VVVQDVMTYRNDCREWRLGNRAKRNDTGHGQFSLAHPIAHTHFFGNFRSVAAAECW